MKLNSHATTVRPRVEYFVFTWPRNAVSDKQMRKPSIKLNALSSPREKSITKRTAQNKEMSAVLSKSTNMDLNDS